MPVITTKAAGSAQGYGEFTASAPKVYIEDVFSTYLYTGVGASTTVTNGIDLAGKGGLVWWKSRANLQNNWLVDSARVTDFAISSNTTSAQSSGFGFTFNSNGYTGLASSGFSYASWTFRKQPKFFDVVTYTGNGSNRTIPHNLGSVPGCIIVKRTDTTANWQVYHRSLSNTEYLVLNTTAAKATGATRWNSTTPTSTEFSLGTDTTVNASGGTYVAYLFAHDAGGFGLSGTDNVISCGSFTTPASGDTTVTLGYEPQWILFKRTDAVETWRIYDTMRGLSYASNGDARLFPNTSDEESYGDVANLTATGFVVQGGTDLSYSATYIYIAIRRGPMKVPTSGTSVFSPAIISSPDSVTTNFPVDLSIARYDRATAGNNLVLDRLRGVSSTSSTTASWLVTSSAGAENSSTTNQNFFNNTGFSVTGANNNGPFWSFRRAPGFFDVVCYTGTGVARTVNHNLGVAPQMVIVKSRANVGGFSQNWIVNHYDISSYDAYLNSSSLFGATKRVTATSSTTFTVTIDSEVNASGTNYVAYLFATVAGVSKVGSYTGTGTTLQIDCGFTGGARFILIKRTDSTGDWYVYDTARGIVSGNDPYLFLNSTAAEVTTTDYIDPYNAGFELSSTAPAGLNANGGTYIFLAIA